MSTENAKTISEAGGRKYKAPALEKGLDILELLAQEGEPLNTPQIASRLGRSVSELFRMILTLENRGYIVQARGREGYGLTNKLFSMGLAQSPVRSLIELATPEMKMLADTVSQSCHMTVLSNHQIVVVSRIESPRDMGFAVRLGYRRPAVESTSGVLLYAFMSEEDREKALNELAQVTDEQAMNQFKQRVEKARERTYVSYPSDFVKGVIDLAAPIIGNKGVIAALIVPYVNCFPEISNEDETLQLLVDTSVRLSKVLQAEGK